MLRRLDKVLHGNVRFIAQTHAFPVFFRLVTLGLVKTNYFHLISFLSGGFFLTEALLMGDPMTLLKGVDGFVRLPP